MPEMNSNRVRMVDGHLPDAWILHSIDKEISLEDCEFVEAHLRSCAQCRSMEQQLRATIDALRAYNRMIVAPSASLSPSHKSAFESKLNRLSDELAHRRRFSIPNVSAALWHICNLLSLQEWIFAGVALSLIVVIGFYRLNTPTVSAKEILIRSEAYEQNSLHGINDPIIVQRIRISANGRQSERTLYRDLKRNRHVHVISGKSEDDRAVDSVLQKASMDTDELILPGLFLRASSACSSSTVAERQSEHDTIVLSLHLPCDTIADADLTLRAADYHTIAARLRLSDQTMIQISELSYQVVQFETLRADLFDVTISNIAPAFAKASLPNAVSDLAGSEIKALSILHRLHAELGGEINVDDSDPKAVKIEGVVENLDRKQELEGALRNTPAIQLNIETIAQKRTTLRPQVYDGRGTLTATSTPPLLDKQLKEWFPAPEDRREYVRAVLSYGQSASSHAWVLEELTNHFPHARCLALRPKEWNDLDSLLLEESNSLNNDLAGLKRQSDMILIESAGSASASTSARELREEELRNESTADWHDQVHALHSALDQVNDNLATLIVGAGVRSTSSDHLRSETYQLLSSLSVDLHKFRRRLSQSSDGRTLLQQEGRAR